MDPSQSKTGPANLSLGVWPARVLAGLQAGVLAGFVMAAWLMLENLRRGQPVWMAFNQISTVLLGYAGLKTTFGGPTLVGLSLQLVMAGLHGAVFAVVVPPTVRALSASSAGVLLSLGSYSLFFGWALQRMAPLFLSRASRPAWLGACFLFGAAWGFYGVFVRELLRPEIPPVQVLSAEPVSGIESESTKPSSTAP